MWRVRFRQQHTENWLWTAISSKTAREAQSLGSRIARGNLACDLLTADGKKLSCEHADAARDYVIVPAEDIGYAPEPGWAIPGLYSKKS